MNKWRYEKNKRLTELTKKHDTEELTDEEKSELKDLSKECLEIHTPPHLAMIRSIFRMGKEILES